MIQNVENLVKGALADSLHISNLSEIQLDHHLRKDLRLDSMTSLMFLMKLEEKIKGFYVDPETLGNSDLETVDSIVKYVNYQIRNDKYVH